MDKKVLSVLEQNRGRPVSGSEMATALGVSRNSIWKAVAKLKQAGYPILSSPRRGYLLSETSDILSPEGIRSCLSHAECGGNLTVFPVLPSTNRCLKSAAAEGAPAWTVVVADRQTAGRGRMERSFYSPAGSGIYMSILLRPDRENADALFLTVTAAVAVRRALFRLTGREIGIKWVNDLYLDRKKICGILCEGGFEMETGRIAYVVVGIGINVHPVDFPEELRPIAGFLSEEPINRNAVIAAVLDELYEMTRTADKESILAEYRAHSILLGKELTVIANDGTRETATALRIDPEAHLVVRTASGEEKVLFSGEVSIKL